MQWRLRAKRTDMGFRKRRYTSVFLVLIFIPFWSQAGEQRSSSCCRLCSELHQIAWKQQTVDPAVYNRDTLVDSTVTVYWIHIIDYKQEWWQHTPLSHDLMASNRRLSTPHSSYTKVFTKNPVICFLEVKKTCLEIFGIFPRFLESLL